MAGNSTGEGVSSTNEDDIVLRSDSWTPEQRYGNSLKCTASYLLARELGDNPQVMGSDYIYEFNAEIQARVFRTAAEQLAQQGILDPAIVQAPVETGAVIPEPRASEETFAVAEPVAA